MSAVSLGPLVGLTLRAPKDAAAVVMGWGLHRNVLWMALAVVAIFNSVLIYWLIASSPPEAQSQFPGYFASPFAVFVLLAGIMVLYIYALYWAALAMSGSGRFDDLLALMVWLQVLRTGVQIIVLVLTVLVPPVAGVLSIVAFVWGLWILLNFLAAALNLSSAGHALVVLVIGIIGLVLGVGILMAAISLVAGGAVGNV